MNTNTKTRFVNDLGIAAFLLMHGYAVVGKKAKSIYFEVPDDDTEFDNLILEYQPANEFYTFDSCLMYIKKINEMAIPSQYEESDLKVVTDFGAAAYLLMQKYKPNAIKLKFVGKRGKNIYFYVPEEKKDDFDRLTYQYLPSPFHSYDSNLVALKKHGEYMPSKWV